MNNKKVIMVLMDGFSFEMMKFPELVDLSFLKKCELKNFYPECIQYKEIWKKFKFKSFLNPSIDRSRSISSSDMAAMMSTGLSKNYIDFNWEKISLSDYQIFNKLHKRDIKVAALTNMPITDSTVGMFLKADEVNTYTPKTDITKVSYSNTQMQHNIAEDILNESWDLLGGGGRMFFYPNDVEDPILKGEYGTREDGKNILDQISKDKNVNLIYEDTYSSDSIDWNYKRNLVLLHHHDFMFEAERNKISALEPRLSEISMDFVDALNKSEKDWFFLIESGKVDPGAHNNNSYFVLGEILEIYRFLYKLSLREDFEDYTVIFTSDHATGGMAFSDSYNLPYDGFKEGLTWSDGPGKNRYDTTMYMRERILSKIEPYTPEFKEKKNFRSQPSAIEKNISLHSRHLVPYLVNGIETELFTQCNNHIDLYYSLLKHFEIEMQDQKGQLLIITGPPAAGKSTISKKVSKMMGYTYIKGDDYLNHIAVFDGDFSDDTLDITMENILFDSEVLLKNNVNVVVDFVAIREQELMYIKKLSDKYNVSLVVLDVDVDEIKKRDLMRKEDERMGDRCIELAKNFKDRNNYNLFPAIYVAGNGSVDDVVNRIIKLIKK